MEREIFTLKGKQHQPRACWRNQSTARLCIMLTQHGAYPEKRHFLLSKFSFQESFIEVDPGFFFSEEGGQGDRPFFPHLRSKSICLRLLFRLVEIPSGLDYGTNMPLSVTFIETVRL